MQSSGYKSHAELAFSLQGSQHLALLACSVCANFSRTGGHKGLSFMREVLRDLGKDIVLARCVTGCCLESVLRDTLERALPPVAQRCDALVMLSCSSGVKTAWHISPGIPVVAACDTLGARPVSRSSDIVRETPCRGCGQCVLSYTAGICPLSACPLSLHAPCAQAPLESGQDACARAPARNCVWKTILAQGGDLASLSKFDAPGLQRSAQGTLHGSLHPWLTRVLAGMVSRTSGLAARLIPFLE